MKNLNKALADSCLWVHSDRISATCGIRLTPLPLADVSGERGEIRKTGEKLSYKSQG